MGFVLSIFYFVTSYLTPPTLFGPLAAYRIELILAILILLVSLPRLTGSFILKTPQSLALIGLAIATVLSVLFGEHWAGGAMQAFLGFIPNAFAFFLVCLHCNSKRKLQGVVLMLLFVCLFVIAHGGIDLLLHGDQQAEHYLPTDVYSSNADAWQMEHPYLLPKPNDREEPNRLKGLGVINDPNDFGQLTVCVIPLMFIFWRTKKMIWNIGMVIVPACALLLGVYLTHSRGALLALTAMAIVAARRRIGTLPALLLAGALFASAMALQFTGGRAISAESGADRTSLWGQGLEIFKAHPLFGVGFGNMPDYTDDHHTAHNTVVVCAVELGLFGLYFWSLFLFTTARDALAVASPTKVTEGEPIVPEESPFPQSAWKVEVSDKAEINHLGRLMVLSLTGFLVAGIFLSRAYVMTFFLLGGMVEVVFQMALDRGMIAPRLSLARALTYASGLAISLLLAMYALLRIVNLTHLS
jgi:O-antigen ligase